MYRCFISQKCGRLQKKTVKICMRKTFPCTVYVIIYQFSPISLWHGTWLRLMHISPEASSVSSTLSDAVFSVASPHECTLVKLSSGFSSLQSVLDYQPYSLADLPVSIFGNFYADRHDKRLRYLQDVRVRVLGRVGTHPHDLLTTDDVIIDDGIPNIR